MPDVPEIPNMNPDHNPAAGPDVPLEHVHAERTARRRTRNSLVSLATEARDLIRRLDAGQVPYASDLQPLSHDLFTAIENAGALESLRDGRKLFGPAETELVSVVRSMARLTTDSTNPTSHIAGLVETARELIPDWMDD